MEELKELERWALVVSTFLEDHLSACEKCYYGIVYSMHDPCRVGVVLVNAKDAAEAAVVAACPDWYPF